MDMMTKNHSEDKKPQLSIYKPSLFLFALTTTATFILFNL
ncbi:hypothetical protein GHNINEIG_00594 [Hydrogenovibrio crunogenus]|uniref:Uncharacterized protein n=1 Tax=Hydrogenovibrio crunogenus TaxID=39765 RepID=A0A4P7P010_9GAMM|nr:hypothetical protein GHNINEIG_00594 [Hydrogenovibrio crunogenus]